MAQIMVHLRILLLVMAAVAPLGAQGRVTFAVAVADQAGAPIPDVKVTVSGTAQRTSRTEGGRLVFEGMPAGAYRFRFDKDGFVPLERELTARVPARGAAPIDVKVVLTPTPPPPPPPAPAAPPAPRTIDASLVVLDMPAFIEKYYVGKAAGRTTALGCATGAAASLIQINDAVLEHAHADADEFIYVIAGQGSAKFGTRLESLGPGVFFMIPRGTAHSIVAGKKKPIEMVSMLAGGTPQPCQTGR